MICSNCDFNNPDTNRFCGNCGKLLSRDCPNCGAANPPSYKFCGNCGFDLSQFMTGAEPQPQNDKLGLEVHLNQSDNGNQLVDLKGERRIATVLVADVKKSTELLTQIGTEAWVDLMSKLLQVMEAQIYRYEGQVDQFRGDGLIAFFGTRDAHEDDPERAILAALAMQDAFEQYKWEFEPFDLEQVKLRIGINTDELIVAKIGTEGLHREDTAMGEAVTLAARLETAAEPGTILVSESTQSLTQNKFHWMDLGEIELKGIQIQKHVFRPIAVRTETEILQDLQNYMPATPLIGRYEEYDLLRQNVDQVLNDKGGVVFISGERGLGKSFLVRQVYQNLLQRKFIVNTFSDIFSSTNLGGTSGKLLWLQSWCSSYEQLSPFFLWRILLKSWLGFQSDLNETEMFKRLTILCQELWPENHHDRLLMLGSLLSILPDELSQELAALDSQGFQGKVFYSIREWLRAISGKTPLVISLRSIQWANSASFDLLRDVIILAKEYPILWLVDYRPENDFAIQQLEKELVEEKDIQFNKIVLHPLDDEEAENLVEYLLQPYRPNREVLHKIVEKAEGNPYFIQELVTNLIDEGVLVKDNSAKRWRLTKPIDSTDLPDSLQSLFLSKIDKLSSADRLILQMASAIGYLFWARVIEQIVPEDVQVDKGLVDLQQAGFIENRSVNIDLGTTFAFSSTLIRDVAYESILTGQKQELHARIADYLRNYIEDQEISPSLVAFHYQIAGNLRLELLYRLDAAVKAGKVFANEEAFQEYSRALSILDLLEEQDQNERSIAIESQRFELVKGRAEILYYLGRVFEAQSEARRLLAIADRIPDEPVWQVDALLMQPGVNFIQNKEMLQEGIPQAEKALAFSRQIGDRHREMLSLIAVVHHKILLKNPDWKALGSQAISIADELGDKNAKVDLLLMMADAYGLDELDQGLQLIKQAYIIAQEISYNGAQVELLYWLGAEFERDGDYVTLLHEFEEKRLKLSQKLGWRLIEARSLMFMGQTVGLYLGDYQKGLSYLDQAEKIWQDVDFRVFVYLRKAQTLIEIGQMDKACAYLELAKPLAVGFVEGIGKVGFELVQAIYHIRVGGLDHLLRALESTSEVLSLIEEQNLVSRQYCMAASCKASQASLLISQLMQQGNDLSGYRHYLQKAIEYGKMALNSLNDFGFTQIIEVVSEEILFTFGKALLESGQIREGRETIAQSYKEIKRKLSMIPENSPYKEFYENMPLHKEILGKYKELI